jgi:Asp-tRNA(Asn)/Glu-tRNA(Gln) amidotransferase B subunit
MANYRYEADLLVAEFATANFFGTVARKHHRTARAVAANWIINALAVQVNKEDKASSSPPDVCRGVGLARSANPPFFARTHP